VANKTLIGYVFSISIKPPPPPPPAQPSDIRSAHQK